MLGLGLAPVAGQEPADSAGEDVVEHLQWALTHHPIVLLGEGHHANLEPHQLLRRVVSDPRILDLVDVIVVEFATATHQEVLDAFIRGDDVPVDEVRSAWRDTSTSPAAPWSSPLYRELLETVRTANLERPREDRVRVVAGDPPVDWPSIETGADYRQASQPRDPYAAAVVTEQAFGLGQRVLVIYGGHHLQRLPLGPGDLRNPMTSYILAEYPDAVWVVEFAWPALWGMKERSAELRPGTAYRTDGHWLGTVPAHLHFAGSRSLVTDPETGERSWQEIPLYEGHVMRDLFDALIYLGPEDEWTVVPPALDPVRDAAYLAELERRRVLRFGGGSPGR